MIMNVNLQGLDFFPLVPDIMIKLFLVHLYSVAYFSKIFFVSLLYSQRIHEGNVLLVLKSQCVV